MTRDLTKAQFDAACRRHEFRPAGFGGYYHIDNRMMVSVLNAGRRYRDQLAYLIRQRDRFAVKTEKGA